MRSKFDEIFFTHLHFSLKSKPPILGRLFVFVSLSLSLMSSSAMFLASNPPYSVTLSDRTFLCRSPTSVNQFSIKASNTSINFAPPSIADKKTAAPTKIDNWEWRFKGNAINIYYEEHERESADTSMKILMLPTISDVSTVEEWRSVASAIVGRAGRVNWQATIVDWPGLGFSGRPKMDYDADVMEKFIVDLINSPDSPVSSPENKLVVFGGGHAATMVVRATQKKLVKPKAIAAIAPTWAGPLPIVFGRDSSMETRYGLLRGTLRAPAVGWMMYNMLVSNEKAIESQYKSHVYANPQNVTPAFVQSRYELTKQKGARYVPASFLTGLLDPVTSREEFVNLFADLGVHIPVLVVSTEGSPKRSKAEMEALLGAKGVSKFVRVPGALLAHEEYPARVGEELYKFLQEYVEINH